ncbi:hypothetical protein L596_025050 [Steinernema carpocapsae]|uniref:Uncharacterized protein n=1 Tax=Steinernema carpocapsae TaxID=34508 RepID=A0A4U5M6N5_STECR|nr:hypothetical protein L596_025050 [Steinernema carpocapsae]
MDRIYPDRSVEDESANCSTHLTTFFKGSMDSSTLLLNVLRSTRLPARLNKFRTHPDTIVSARRCSCNTCEVLVFLPMLSIPLQSKKAGASSSRTRRGMGQRSPFSSLRSLTSITSACALNVPRHVIGR